MLICVLLQVIDNMKGIVEIMASSDEIAVKAQKLAERLLEEPEFGRIYRLATLSITLDSPDSTKIPSK